MATCNAYPKFEANQVLTAEQLNQLSVYLRNQDMLTRRRLIGIGTYCGLCVSTIEDSTSTSLQISSGCGVTSEGDLIELTKSINTHYRSYLDQGGYSLFLDDSGQVSLWELCTPEEITADDDSQPLTSGFLQNKIVLIYLECRENDLKTCVGDDCDEYGIQVEACIKKLIIDIADADRVIQKARKIVSKGNSAYLDKFNLKEIRIKRSSDLLELDRYITPSDLVTYYQGLIRSMLDEFSRVDKTFPVFEVARADEITWTNKMTRAYELSWEYHQSYQTYEMLLREDFDRNPFLLGKLNGLLNQIIDSNKMHYQYVYDFFKDLIDAYNEFRQTTFDLAAECCPDRNHFPKHLLIGEAISVDPCIPSAYRQQFVPAPLFNRQSELRDRCRSLFRRMYLLIYNFRVPTYKEGQVRITPSVGPSQPLSQRTIPFYYLGSDGTGIDKLRKIWNYDLMRFCQTDHQLSYHSTNYTDGKLPFIDEPLAYKWDDYPFLRVEGHIGGRYSVVSAEIEEWIRRYNLPIQLVGLRLDAYRYIVQPGDPKYIEVRSKLKLTADVLGIRRDQVETLIDVDRLLTEEGLNPAYKTELIKTLDGSETTLSTSTSTSQPTLQKPLDISSPSDSLPVCRYQDLEAIYASLRSELICLLEKEALFFGNLKFDDKQKTYSPATGGNTGFTGTVLDLSGRPQKGAEVIVLDSNHKNAVAKGTTAEDGSFDLKGLPPGQYYALVYCQEIEVSKELVEIKQEQTLAINYFFQAAESAATTEEQLGAALMTADQKLVAASSTKSVDEQTMFRGASPKVELTAARSAATTSSIARSELEMAIPKAQSLAATGMTRVDPLMQELEASRSVVLGAALSQPSTVNTIGQFYKELDESTLQEDQLSFSYEFFKRHPFATWDRIPDVFTESIHKPMKLLATIDELESSLPDALVGFVYTEFETKFQAMIAAAKEYKIHIESKLEQLNQELIGNEDELLIHLDRLLAACHLVKFQSIYKIYTDRIEQLEDLTRFASFIQEYTGVEHLAGVYKGGTFILVYNAQGIVVADFSLPYICCSQCLPTNLGVSIPVVFKLPGSEFCKSDPNRYKVITNVPGETVEGPGLEMEETTGDWYFYPAREDVGTGTVRFTYMVEYRRYTFEARILEVDASFTHEVAVDEFDPNQAIATFVANTTDANGYHWDFGDGVGEPSTEKNPIHTYTLTDTEQSIDVTLTIERGICCNVYTKSIILPASAVEPLEINIESTDFCSNDQNRYALSVSPVDDQGTVSSDAGGIVFENGVYFFEPSQVGFEVGPVEITYIVGSRSVSLTVQLHNPLADFIAGVPEKLPSGGYSVSFTNTSSNNPDTYAWSFGVGQGQTSSERDPVMDFADLNAGEAFEVSLTVSVNGQCPNTKSSTVRVPEATDLTISLEKNRFCKGENKQYLIEVSPKQQNGLVTGEGVEQVDEDFFFNPSKTTTTVGPITLTYAIAASQAEVTIQLLNPSADFSFNQPKKLGTGVYQVQFTNNSINANTYSWSFGDGQTSSDESPLITFKNVESGQVLTVVLRAAIGQCVDVRTGRLTIPLDLSISLDDTVFCKRSQDRYEILVEPLDPAGKVFGSGVVREGDQFFFIPSDDQVKVGINTLTYQLGNRSTSTNVTVANPQAGFTPNFERPSETVFTIRFDNTSQHADTYKWSILPPTTPIPLTSVETEPIVNLPRTKPGDLVRITLEASLQGRCRDVLEDTYELPDIASPGEPPLPSELELILKRIERHLKELQQMPTESLFRSAFGTVSDPVYKDTLDLLNMLIEDLSDQTIVFDYLVGERNDELAKRFGSIFNNSVIKMERLQGIELRQYVYRVVQISIELMPGLAVIQKKDLTTDSGLFMSFINMLEMMNQFLGMGINLDRDGNLAETVNVFIQAAEDKPNLLKALQKIMALIK